VPPAFDPHEEVTCGICLDIIADPRLVRCCRTASCQRCIADAVALTGLCPYCRDPAPTRGGLLHDLAAERRASAVIQTCRNAGCAFSGARDAFNAHRKVCPRRPLAQIIYDVAAGSRRAPKAMS
jgi:hypothetical protein